MGIEVQAARAMAHIFPQGIYQDARLLMLGRQFCRFGPKLEEVKTILEGSSYQLDETITLDPSPFHPSLIAPESYFKLLGCKQVQSMDVRPNEGAEIIYDLNGRDLPADLIGGYDLIYDGGTTEHVLDIVQAFRNISQLLTVGGHVIHHLPCHGYVNEGFYQINPTFLKTIHEANGFEILNMSFFHWTKGVADWSSLQVYDVSDKAHESFFATDSFRNLTGGLDVVCLARKIEDRDHVKLAIQDMYL